MIADESAAEAWLRDLNQRRGRQSAPRFGLMAIESALAAIGNPQRFAPPAVHVTGTNGKGSTTAFLRALAEASGRTAHVFTSPHLLRVHERIRIAGRLVDDADLTAALHRIGAAGVDLTYFETLTAAAFDLFARHPADVAIIEVGAGGAGDATNVVETTAVAVVTPISRDHEALFGVTGEAGIARIKAGVMRAGRPVVIARQPAPAREALELAARERGAQVLEEGVDWRAGADALGRFTYESPRRRLEGAVLALSGRHQAGNAGAAIAAADALGWKLDADHIREGVAAARWPARFQRLAAGGLTRGVGAPVIVDGAHNPSGAAALAAELRSTAGEGPAGLVFAAQQSKDAAEMIGALKDDVCALAAVPLPDSGGQEGGPGRSPAEIAQAAQGLGLPARLAASIEEAGRALVAAGAVRIVVAGSLYLCGAALRANGETVD